MQRVRRRPRTARRSRFVRTRVRGARLFPRASACSEGRTRALSGLDEFPERHPRSIRLPDPSRPVSRCSLLAGNRGSDRPLRHGAALAVRRRSRSFDVAPSPIRPPTGARPGAHRHPVRSGAGHAAVVRIGGRALARAVGPHHHPFRSKRRAEGRHAAGHRYPGRPSGGGGVVRGAASTGVRARAAEPRRDGKGVRAVGRSLP